MLLIVMPSASGLFKITKGERSGQIKVEKGDVVGVTLEGCRSNANATEILLEIIKLDDASLEFTECDEGNTLEASESLVPTSMPILTLLDTNFGLPAESKMKQAIENRKEIDLFGDVLTFEELQLEEHKLFLFEDLLFEDLKESLNERKEGVVQVFNTDQSGKNF